MYWFGLCNDCMCGPRLSGGPLVPVGGSFSLSLCILDLSFPEIQPYQHEFLVFTFSVCISYILSHVIWEILLYHPAKPDLSWL